MDIKVQDEKRAALIAGLRELATFLEQHPEVPTPSYPSLLCGTGALAEVETAAAALGNPVEAVPFSGDDQRVHRHEVTGRFGNLEFCVYWIVRSAELVAGGAR